LIVHGGVEAGGILLDDAQDTGGSKGVLGNMEESVHEIFFS
jgi:hypothetical protein